MQLIENTMLFWRNPWRLAFGVWRLALWGLVVTLLLLPLIAMQFTAEVHWTGFDFVVAAILLGGTALCIEAGCRYSLCGAGRIGWALGVLASVGIGALWGRFQARAMCYSASAGAQCATCT